MTIVLQNANVCQLFYSYLGYKSKKGRRDAGSRALVCFLHNDCPSQYLRVWKDTLQVPPCPCLHLLVIPQFKSERSFFNWFLYL